LLEDAHTNAGAGKPASREAEEGSRRNFRRAALRLAGATAACTILVVICVELVDRPVASWVHEHLGDHRWVWLHARYDGRLLPVGPFTLMAGPAEALHRIAALVFSGLVVAALAGWRPSARGRIVLALCLAVFAAVEINAAMKIAFGRTWPESWLGDNPSWVRNGVFGFFPFHGGRGWGSFPSGHTTGVVTPAAVLWVVWPEMRVVWVAIVVVVVAGLVGGNYHFVSDIIGGVFIGACLGFGVVRLCLNPDDRLHSSIVLNSKAGRRVALEIAPAIRASHPRLSYETRAPTSIDGNRTDKTIVSPTASQECMTSGPKMT